MGARTLLGKLVTLGTLVIAGLAVVPGAALAQPLLGVTTDNQIVRFDSATPATIASTLPIVNLPAGTDILAIDYRPVTGQLYGLGSNDRIYRLDPGEICCSTPPFLAYLASSVGDAFTFPLASFNDGFDFNPVADRARVVSDEEQNFRLNPNDGSQTADADLAFAPGDPNLGDNPAVTASAYSNNRAQATSTTLYGIDTANDVLVRQNPPDDGTLLTVGPLGIDAAADLTGFDVTPGAGGAAFAALDPGGAGVSRLYTVNLSTGAATLVGSIGVAIRGLTAPPPLNLRISEFRTRGATNGTEDEFIELYNPNDFGYVIDQTENPPANIFTNGFTVAGSDGIIRFTVPQGTQLDPFDHYLGINCNTGGYTLGGGNVCYSKALPDNKGIALFKTPDTANFSTATRADAVGFTGEANALYREGTGIPNIVALNAQQTIFRDYTTGVSKDTNNNAADFRVADASTTVGAGLFGAPGPEDSSSPVQRNSQVGVALLDPSKSASAVPNREYDPTPVTNGAAGTLKLRRRLTNNTGQTISRLRFRIGDLTTFPAPAGTADLRLLSSSAETVTVSGSPVSVRGLRLEEPPTQSQGGGFNSSVVDDNIFGCCGFQLAPGATVDVVLLFGVQQSGSFRIRSHIEATVP